MRRALASLALAATLAVACGGREGDELLVFAAASLTDSFRALGAAFEERHPGVTVRFNFGPSDGLATQIAAGAPADVFASASQRWMDAVAGEPGVVGRVDFARNRLALIVPEANPAGIRGLEDLTRPGVRLVLAAAGVPAGDYARAALASAGILGPAEANVVSSEIDVKGVVQKVVLGEADAGIVYETDLTPRVAEEVRAVPIPDAHNVTAVYPIAVVRGAPEPELAGAFVRFVAGGEGRGILARFGFLPPA